MSPSISGPARRGSAAVPGPAARQAPGLVGLPRLPKGRFSAASTAVEAERTASNGEGDP